MAIVVSTPAPADLGEVVDVLRAWQREDAPLQLHPGDLGWFWRLGAGATAAAVRIWRADADIVAVALLDGPDVARVTVAPEAWRADDVAEAVAADLADPARGVLPEGEASVEAPNGSRVPEILAERGWGAGEAWTPLRHDLTGFLDHPGLSVEVVGPDRAAAYAAVHRSAFDNPRFVDQRWHAMAAGPAFADARCLLGHDEHGVAVAGVTVWSAGVGRPGLIEPMGVHAAHRGRGHGAAICRAAAAELRALGASSALVCTPTSLAGAVATYGAAGFEALPERLDRVRPA